jgi:hypothetical protein
MPPVMPLRSEVELTDTGRSFEPSCDNSENWNVLESRDRGQTRRLAVDSSRLRSSSLSQAMTKSSDRAGRTAARRASEDGDALVG